MCCSRTGRDIRTGPRCTAPISPLDLHVCHFARHCSTGSPVAMQRLEWTSFRLDCILRKQRLTVKLYGAVSGSKNSRGLSRYGNVCLGVSFWQNTYVVVSHGFVQPEICFFKTESPSEYQLGPFHTHDQHIAVQYLNSVVVKKREFFGLRLRCNRALRHSLQ